MPLLKDLLVDRLGRRDDRFGWRERQSPLRATDYRTVLILHTDAKLGDAIINSLLLDGLARWLPHLEVTVGTSAAFGDYWRSHPNVREALVLPDRIGGNPLARLTATRRVAAPWKGRFDLVVCYDQFAFFDTFALIGDIEAKAVIGFNKLPYRLFDQSLEEHRYGVQARHISSRVSSVLAALGVEGDPWTLSPHIPFGDSDRREASAVLRGPGPQTLLNTYGAGEEKRLTPQAVARMLPHLPGTVYLSVPKGEEAHYGTDDPRVVVVPPLSGFSALFALVAAMDFVVSPDSAVGHIAAALARPQIAIFADPINIPVVWRPMNARCEVVVSTGRSASELNWDEFTAAAERMRTT